MDGHYSYPDARFYVVIVRARPNPDGHQFNKSVCQLSFSTENDVFSPWQSTFYILLFCVITFNYGFFPYLNSGQGEFLSILAMHILIFLLSVNSCIAN